VLTEVYYFHTNVNVEVSYDFFPTYSFHKTEVPGVRAAFNWFAALNATRRS